MLLTRACQSLRPSPYFVTTPIFYVNSAPHLGHLYSCLLANAHARYTRLQRPGENTIFSTGTDEHGLKVQQAASRANKTPAIFCDDVSEKFRNLFDKCNIDYTSFIRTSSDQHKHVVSKVWTQMTDKGDLYKSEYSGWYSVQEEAFVPEGSVEQREGGQTVSSETGQPLEWASEVNWMFRLSQYQEALLRWHRDSAPVSPPLFRGQVTAWITEGLIDLSVSRPASRLHWGVPVPGDPEQTIYVWIDALCNYLTVARYPDLGGHWPPSVQVLGKDILKFHSIYWPAMLMSLGLELPQRLLVHSHWTVDNVKMSKSLGNVVDPDTLSDKYSTEGVRYFLLREGVPHSDGNFSETSMAQLLNLELADTLGNLLNRCSAKGVNKLNTIPKYPSEYRGNSQLAQELENQMKNAKDMVGESYDQFNFYQGCVHIMSMLRLANQFVQEQQPWTLKHELERDKLHWVLSLTFECLRISGILLQPVVPDLASRLLDKLNVEAGLRGWSEAAASTRASDATLRPGKTVLFNKIR